MSRASAALGFGAYPDWLPPLVFGAGGGAIAAIALAVAASRGIIIGLILAVFMLAIAIVSLRPVTLLIAFVVLLPLHLLVMVLLFNAGIDHFTIRAYSAWKEVISLGLLAVLVLRCLANGELPRTRALDAVVLAFFAINLIYLAPPVPTPISVPLAGRLQGFRDNTFFVILYFIGRLAPLSVKHVRWFASAALGIGTAGVIIGLWERFALPLDFFFEPLHFDDFVRDYLNLHFYTGIPFNFWTSVSNVRRGVSFYLGSHHFAMASALLLPLVLVLRRPLRPFPAALRAPLILLFLVGLALPLTRSVMLACLVQVLIIGWFTRRPHYMLTAVLSVMLLLGSSLVLLDLSGYFRNVAAAVPGSSVASHIASWQDTRDIVRNYPLGVGFGVTDTVAERTGGGPAGVMGGEGEYAFTVTSVGIPGLLLFVALQATAAWTLLRTRQTASSPAMRQLALITLAMLAAYIVVGGFTQVRHIPAFLFPLWWLVGTVTRGSLDGDPLAAA